MLPRRFPKPSGYVFFGSEAACQVAHAAICQYIYANQKHETTAYCRCPDAGTALYSQVGVGYYHSQLPFVGLNIGIKKALRSELRLGTNLELDNLSVEGILTYHFVNRPDYTAYAGAGVMLSEWGGIVVPLGMQLYPFPEKKFGFHMEIAPIFQGDAILRGSWGIRYQFNRKE